MQRGEGRLVFVCFACFAHLSEAWRTGVRLSWGCLFPVGGVIIE